jgi:pentatricopeptide repeat protein
MRKMRERGGIDPDKYTYATVISGWCKTARIEDAAKVFDEMLAAGEAKPSLRIVSHQTSDSGKHAGGASHSDGSKREIGMIEFIGILNVKVIGGKRRTRDVEDGRWPGRVDASSLAREMHEERRAGRRGGDRMRRARRSHAWRAPFIHAEVEVGATQRRFDAQRKTGGGGRPALMASQQMERAAELQNPEVRAELNRHVRECERKCFASSRLGSIPQASARARQQATREQVESQ